MTATRPPALRYGATRRERVATGIVPRELVFNLTQRMMARGDVQGRRLRDSGKWHFTWQRKGV